MMDFYTFDANEKDWLRRNISMLDDKETELPIIPESAYDIEPSNLGELLIDKFVEQEIHQQFQDYLTNLVKNIGHWKYVDENKWSCSVCGKDNLYDAAGECALTYYCPNCGVELLKVEDAEGNLISLNNQSE